MEAANQAHSYSTHPWLSYFHCSRKKFHGHQLFIRYDAAMKGEQAGGDHLSGRDLKCRFAWFDLAPSGHDSVTQCFYAHIMQIYRDISHLMSLTLSPCCHLIILSKS